MNQIKGFIASFLLVFCLGTSGLQAEVLETATMAVALKDADTKTLVVLDIDNTILAPDQMLGSDQWYDHLYETLTTKQKLSEKQAWTETDRIWAAVQQIVKVHAVESDTPARVAALQTSGIKVMALTARPLDIATTTFRQLASVGIDLQKNSVHKKTMFVPLANGERGRFEHGVLFANGNDKGKLLVAFMKQIKLKPAHIVFVDDKRRNADNVERALTAAAIPHVVHRYSACDADVKAFDGETADIQYFYLQNVLSDSEAGTLKQAAAAATTKKWQSMPAWTRK